MRGVRVACNTFVKTAYAYTDDEGCYQMSEVFPSKPRYRLIYKNSAGFAIGFNLLLVPASVSSLGRGETTGLDLVVDGHYVESLKNFENPTFGTNYVTMEASFGDFSKVFDLGAGEKEVALYLPWSVGCVITGLELADGASFIPVKREKKLLAMLRAELEG